MIMLTFVYAYYENPNMFLHQQREWWQYSEHARDRIEFIITDDGSPNRPAAKAILGTRNFKMRIYRVLKDVRWNYIACRNIGAHEAGGGWLLLMDMDHLITSQTADRIIELLESGQLRGDKAHTPGRRVNAPDMDEYHPHPNTWLMLKDLYWKIGGYDERFSGYYGNDGHFRRVMESVTGPPGVLDEIETVRYSREAIADASTTTYGRKEEIDRQVRSKQRKVRVEGLRPLSLTFPWEQIL